MQLYVDMKPELEWVELADYFYATTDYFDYYVTKSIPHRLFIDFDEHELNLSECHSIDEAQREAQINYERRTAERFKRVEVPEKCVWEGMKYYDGWNDCRDKLMQNIAKAKEQG